MSDSKKISLVAKPESLYPDWVCEGCGRKGGGSPVGGLDNVNLMYGVYSCGHCYIAFSAWANCGERLTEFLQTHKQEAA